jgi:excisionase family DNA binding protein
MNLPIMLTVNQVAELLQVEPRTIRRNIERGDVPAKKIGRIWRIPRTFVQAYLEPAGSDHATTTLHHNAALPLANGHVWGR